jgi:broad specificity phosphatase PhoE
MGRIILVRHGESEGNRERRFSHSTDIDLTELGVVQARSSGELIGERFRPDRIIASPYHRAQRTARIIAETIRFQGGIETEPDLRERAIGELAGETYESLRRHATYDPARFWEWRPQGGESLVDVVSRAGPVLDRLLTAGEDIVAVSHGGVMLALCAHVEGGWTRLRVARNCEVMIVVRGEDQRLRVLSLEEHDTTAAPLGDDAGDGTG